MPRSLIYDNIMQASFHGAGLGRSQGSWLAQDKAMSPRTWAGPLVSWAYDWMKDLDYVNVYVWTNKIVAFIYCTVTCLMFWIKGLDNPVFSRHSTLLFLMVSNTIPEPWSKAIHCNHNNCVVFNCFLTTQPSESTKRRAPPRCSDENSFLNVT